MCTLCDLTGWNLHAGLTQAIDELNPPPEGLPAPTDLQTAEELGVLQDSLSRQGSISDLNPTQIYSFSLKQASFLDAVLGQLQSNANVELIQDKNGNGIIDLEDDVPSGMGEILAASSNPGTEPEHLSALLDPGTYYIRVTQAEGTTPFTLDLTATEFHPPSDTVGNTLCTAQTLSPHQSAFTLQEFVGEADAKDYYHLALKQSSLLNLSLGAFGGDVNLRLIQDRNHNAVADAEEVLNSVELSDFNADTLSDVALQAGDYFLEVSQGEGNTFYTLNLETTAVPMPSDSAGSTLDAARDLGVLHQTQTVKEFVGRADAEDFYQFEIKETSDLTLTLKDLHDDADLILIQDTNGNGVVEGNERLEVSIQSGTTSEQITVAGLAAGTYFAKVEQFSGDTDYTLNLSATPAADPYPTYPLPEPAPESASPSPLPSDFLTTSEIISDPGIAGATPITPGVPNLPSGSTGQFGISSISNKNFDQRALLAGSLWQTRRVTFSFVTAATAPFYREGPGVTTDVQGNLISVVSEVSAAVKQNVRQILDYFSTIFNLEFVELSEDPLPPGSNLAQGIGDIRVMYSPSPSVGYAAAQYPGAGGGLAGDVWLNPNQADSPGSFDNGPGSYGYASLIHELGHALGLKHPGNYNALGGVQQPPFLDPSEDNTDNSVMSYNQGTEGQGFAQQSYAFTLMPYDIAVLQTLYGVNTNTNTGNDTYTLTANELNSTYTIWDAGGIDTLDFSFVPNNIQGYYLDMREGGSSKRLQDRNALRVFTNSNDSPLVTDPQTGLPYLADRNGITIAFNSVMENLTGSANKDYIFGNDVSNIINAGAGDDQVTAGLGADQITLGAGNDTVVMQSSGTGVLNTINAPLDTVLDFTQGFDRVGLLGGLATFPDLRQYQAGNDLYLYNSFANDYEALLRLTNFAGTLTLNDFLGIIEGDKNSNTLNGGVIDDQIDAGAGNDVINAGAGNDRVTSGLGADNMTLGDGNDRVVMQVGEGSNTGIFDVVTDFVQGTDLIEIGGDITRANLGITFGQGNSYLNRYDANGNYVETFLSLSNGLNLNLQTDLVLTGTATAQNDIINGTTGNDTINGGDGNDRILPGLGVDRITLGAGNDRLVTRVGEGSNTPFIDNSIDLVTDFTQGVDLIEIGGNVALGSLRVFVNNAAGVSFLNRVDANDNLVESFFRFSNGVNINLQTDVVLTA